jgi:isoleucyl-tRNA synthetase
MSDTKNDYSKTVQLPETAFAMKAGLAESEPRRVQAWDNAKAYQALRKARAGKKRWILHDGPPFANGDIHMGTALNKILKDICVRYHSMLGEDAPYVPGWDCHGMPIEFKVSKALGAERHKKSALEIRALCKAEAEKYVAIQRQQFKRLGVWGDWEHPYLTLAPEFESAQLDVYWKLLKDGQIYRGLKPVHWCVYDQTALAEAELEYKDHKSTSVYVKYRLEEESMAKLGLAHKNVFAVIWTTTPWTLPASLAITANENFSYTAFEVENECWIVNSRDEFSIGQDGKEHFFEKMKKLEKKGSEVAKYDQEDYKTDLKWDEAADRGIKTFRGKDLENLWAEHPFIAGRRIRFCTAPYVTLETGTGLVHTAPGHGTDDYVTGMRYKLDVLCPVDAQGRYTKQFPQMEGKRVTDPEVNEEIIKILVENNALVARETLSHSYPHCWRCKNPIIFRATEQWFMSLEKNGLRDTVMSEIDKVQWLTRGGKERFSNMMKDRADWCISRQRVWGVPIYMFYCEGCGTEHFDEACYKKIKPIVETSGGDAWFDENRPIGDFLPEGAKCAKCGEAKFRKEKDTLDVWFDSGSSHTAVLKAREDQNFPADLYLEGSDQYRGWFQSSMLVSAGMNGVAPYKAVWSTGWVLDGKGQAMHKSSGNVVNPLDVMKTYGADILRLWCVSEDATIDLRLGEEMLKGCADVYRRLRNSFRWLLGNLKGFEPAQALPLAELEPLDRWLLAELSKLIDDCTKAMQAQEFQRYYARLAGFFSSELSSFVFDVHKDTLYTLAVSDRRRIGAQTVLWEALDILTRLSAPVLAFTSEEVWEQMPASWKKTESVHFAPWPEARPHWRLAELEEDFELLLKTLMPVVKKKLEESRAAKLIGHPYDAKVTLKLHSKKLKNIVDKYKGLLPSLLIVSELALEPDAPRDGLAVGADEVLIAASAHHKCARCWRRPGDVEGEGGICGRCAAAIA